MDLIKTDVKPGMFLKDAVPLVHKAWPQGVSHCSLVETISAKGDCTISLVIGGPNKIRLCDVAFTLGANGIAHPH